MKRRDTAWAFNLHTSLGCFLIILMFFGTLIGDLSVHMTARAEPLAQDVVSPTAGDISALSASLPASGSTQVAFSTGSAFVNMGTWLSNWCLASSGDTFGTGDFNGDGRDDVWCHEPTWSDWDNTRVALNTGSGFTNAGIWISSWCRQSGATFGAADFNADNRADLWCHDPAVGDSTLGKTWVALNTGTSFSDAGVWNNSWCWGAGATFGAADFTADNRADIWCHDPANGTTWVALNTGSSFIHNGVWLSNWCGHSGATFGTGNFDGNGRKDVWCHDTAGKTWVALNTGGFTNAGIWLSGWCWHSGATFGVGNFTGDSRDEVWCHDPMNGTSAGYTWVALNTGSSFTNAGIWLSGWCAQSGATFGTGKFANPATDGLWCHD